MSDTKPTLTEVVESMTGYEEESVFKAFGAYIGDLPTGTMMQRGAVYTLKRRDGLGLTDAKEAAMGLTIKDLRDVFTDDDPDDNPDQAAPALGKPETEQGKGGERSESETENSPLGA